MDRNSSSEIESDERLAVVVLAAGLGTRMKSRTPKELQPLAGLPVIHYVLAAAQSLRPGRIVVVLSPAKAEIEGQLPDGCRVAWQEEQLGTAHAALQAIPLLPERVERVAILFGDHPLLLPQTVRRLVDLSRSSEALVTLLTTKLLDPAGYGRLVYDGDRIVDLVEARDDRRRYDGEVEVNSGISCYDLSWLEAMLPKIPRSASGEYYLTSLVNIAAASNPGSNAVVSLAAPPEETYGTNDRVELAQAEAIIRRRLNEKLMRSGVAIVDPASTFIDAEVEIGIDSRIEPFTTISGQTVIGERCRIGPQAIIEDARIGDDCRILASTVENALIGNRVDVGPYSHLRPGAHLGDDVHIGNFSEVKNATLGRGTKMGHVSYVGDATIGDEVNIGAGAITANFDGVNKHRTTVGNRAFIGTNSSLRAPVAVGDDAVIGAGSVVTHDVDPGTVVSGVPARPMDRKMPVPAEPETADATRREGINKGMES